MALYIIIGVAAFIAILLVGYLLGGRGKGSDDKLTESLRGQVLRLTSERDVQKAQADSLAIQIAAMKENAEKQVHELRLAYEKQIAGVKDSYETM